VVSPFPASDKTMEQREELRPAVQRLRDVERAWESNLFSIFQEVRHLSRAKGAPRTLAVEVRHLGRLLKIAKLSRKVSDIMVLSRYLSDSIVPHPRSNLSASSCRHRLYRPFDSPSLKRACTAPHNPSRWSVLVLAVRERVICAELCFSVTTAAQDHHQSRSRA
jgi:hypothetical protein